MEQLLAHCTRELSWEGNLGCSITRFPAIVQSFYEQPNTTERQIVDEHYVSYIWSLFVRSPSVRTGLLPKGAPPVWIAPDKKSDESEEADLQALGDGVDLSQFSVLLEEYGSALHVAAQRDVILKTLTGSHLQHSKLTPMVYTVLQFVARRRDKGIPVDDITKATGYPSGRVFHLVAALESLGLVLKLRQGGNSSNFAIHRHFWSQSPVWQKIHNAEIALQEASEEMVIDEPAPTSAAVDEPRTSPAIVGEDEFDAEGGGSGDENDAEVATKEAKTLAFDPIDVRFLSSAALVRARVIKLLKHSANHTHACKNMLLAIGSNNPTRSDRRFFRTRINEGIRDGLWEKLLVPVLGTRGPQSMAICLRLLEPGKDKSAASAEAVDDEQAGEGAVAAPPWDVTVESEIVAVLENAGVDGATIKDMHLHLGGLDKRVIEHQLERFISSSPPKHLLSSSITSVLQHYGRERRSSYFLIPHYRSVLSSMSGSTNELDEKQRQIMEVDLSDSGKFGFRDPSEFHDGERKALERAIASINPFANSGVNSRTKAKRAVVIAADGTIVPKKRGRPRKHPLPEDDGDGEVPRKRGRPSKKDLEERVVVPSASASASATKSADGGDAEPSTKKRGRGKKPGVGNGEGGVEGGEHSTPVTPASTKKGKGRARKSQADTVEPPIPAHPASSSLPAASSPATPATPTSSSAKRRGRASKKADEVPVAPEVDADTDMTDASPAVGSETNSSERPIAPPAPVAVIGPSPGAPRGRPRNSRATQPVLAGPTASTSATSAPLSSPATPQPVKRGRARKSQPPPPSSPVVPPASPVVPPASQPLNPIPSVPESPAEPTVRTSPRRAPPATHRPLPTKRTHAETNDEDASGEVQAENVAPSKRARIEVSDEREEAPVASTSADITSPVPNEENGVNGVGEVDQEVEDGSGQASAPPPSVPADSPKTSKPKKDSSITAMRRRNEFLQVLESMDGVAHLGTSEVLDKHAALLRSLKSGGSAPPGTSTDKRTVEKTFEALADLGKVKRTKVAFATSTGAQRMVTIYSLPHVSPTAVQEYVDAYKKNTPAYRPLTLRKLPNTITFDKSHESRLPPVADRTLGQFSDLTEVEEQREWIRSEPRVISQSSGFMLGRFARAREFHLFLLSQMEAETRPSSLLLSPRVFSVDYLWEDMPLGAFCAQIPASKVSDLLREFMDSEENRWLPIHSVPKEVRRPLSISSSRVRKQFHTVLSTLRALGVIVPLKVVAEGQAAAHAVGDLRFDHADDSVTLASHYVFNDVAPLYHFGRIAKNEATLVNNVGLADQSQRLFYWELLQRAAMTDVDDASAAGEVVSFGGDIDLIRPITRSRSWETEYVLSAYQKEYLTKQIDPSTGQHHLGDPTTMRNLEDTTGAPADAIRAFVVKEAQTVLRAVERIRLREQREAESVAKKDAANDLLARKAAELRQRLELDWTNILRGVHPEDLSSDEAVALTPVRDQFFASGGRLGLNFSQEAVETKIRSALGLRVRVGRLPNELNQKARKGLNNPIFVPPPLPQAQIKSTVQNGKSVYDLINAQEARPEAPKKRKKQESDDSTARRKRFRWTEEFDELAIDAIVILEVRAEDANSKVDLAPLRQIFKGTDPIRVRTRYRRVAAPLLGYIQRLKDAWRPLWVELRTSRTLQDDKPTDLRNFDLAPQIQCLRNRIDKVALRAATSEEAIIVMPSDVRELVDRFEILEPEVPRESGADAIFNQFLTEEMREKAFSDHLFASPHLDESLSGLREDVGIAEALIKMTITTSEDSFDSARARELLGGVGEEVLKDAHANLRTSYLAQVEGKRRPGRAYRYQDLQSTAIFGAFPETLYRDALEEEDELTLADGWHTWSLIGSDGSIPVLLLHMSNGTVDAKVNVPSMRQVRDEISGNSKRIVDHNYEVSLMFRERAGFPLPAIEESPSTSTKAADTSLPETVESAQDDRSHGTTARGEPASCSMSLNETPGRVVDCSACLQRARRSVPELGDEKVQKVLDSVKVMGSSGVTVDALCSATLLSRRDVHRAIRILVKGPLPSLYRVGYGTDSVIVSADSVSSWTAVVAPQEGSVDVLKVLPRRWRDVNGQIVVGPWSAGLKAVLSTVMVRPGISEVELIERLQDVFDALEVRELLERLRDEQFVARRIDPGLDIAAYADEVAIGTTNGEEGSGVYWTLNADRAWWKIHG